MAVVLMLWPVGTGEPLRVSVPTVGSETIVAAWNALAGPVPVGGVSFGSVKPKSASVIAYDVSSRTGPAALPLVPAGASVTELTVTVITLGVGSVLPLGATVLPSSLTWNVMLGQ